MKYYEFAFTIDTASEYFSDACDLVAALACEVGFETFEETTYGLLGYIQQPLLDIEALNDILDDFPIADAVVTYTYKEAEYKDWNEEWEKNGFAPIIVGNRCAIHDGRHLPEGNYNISIEIDAHMAFGTGTHETTRMIANLILDANLAGKSFLDCGTGTGILSIVALKSGASCAVAYDIDEWSTQNAMHNAIINLVDSRFSVMLGDSSVLDSVNERFDVVAANINRNILLADMPRFCHMLNNGGTLLLSGFYHDDADSLINKASDLGMHFVKETTDGDWSALLFVLD